MVRKNEEILRDSLEASGGGVAAGLTDDSEYYNIRMAISTKYVDRQTIIVIVVMVRTKDS